MIDLRQGDCLELMKEIPNKSVDMILCDLPYGTTKCKWDIVIPFDKLWEQYERIIKDNGAIVLFGSEPFSSRLRLSNLKNYKYDWVWDKVVGKGHLVAKIRPLQRTENIMVFGKGKINYYPIMRNRPIEKCCIGKEGKRSEIVGGVKKEQEYKMYKTYYPNNLLTFNNHNPRKKVHPCEKSVQLLEYLIKTYTNENELVLDNCMGSGSTGVACINTNRSFIGMELDKNYFEIAKNRIESCANNKNVL